MGTLAEIYSEEFFDKLKKKITGEDKKEEKRQKEVFDYDKYLNDSVGKLARHKEFNQETISKFSLENNCGLFIFSDAVYCFKGWFNGLNNREYFIERNMNMSMIKVPTLVISADKFNELQEKYKSQKKNYNEGHEWTPKMALMAFDDITAYNLDLNDHVNVKESNYTDLHKRSFEFSKEDLMKLPNTGSLDYINDTYWRDINDKSIGKSSTRFIPICSFSYRSKTSIVHGKIMDSIKLKDGRLFYIVPLIFCNLMSHLGGYKQGIWSLA